MLDTAYEPQRDLDPNLYLVRVTNSACVAHFHRSVELIYLISGRTEVTVSGETFVAEADDMIFFSEYKTHRIHPLLPPSDSVHLIVPYDMLPDYRKFVQGKLPPWHLCDRAYNRSVLPYLLAMLDADRANGLAMRGFIDLILGLIVGHYPLREDKRDRGSDAIIELIRYLDEHYRENLTLEDTARRFGYSTYYFSKIFNRYMGTSFLSYLNNVRLKHLAAILPDSRENITDLALDFGFESVSTFYRNFKHLYGVSPTEYVQRKRAERA